MSKRIGQTVLRKIMKGAARLPKIMLGASELFPRFDTGFNPGTPVDISSWTSAGTGVAAGIGFDVFSNDGSGGFSGQNTTTGGNRMALSAPTFGIVAGQSYYFECDIVSTDISGTCSIGFNTNQRSNNINFAAGFSGKLTGVLTITNTNASGCSFRVVASAVGTIVVANTKLWLSPISLLPGDGE